MADFTDLGNRFTISVDDRSGVWTLIWEYLKKRVPLRQVTFKSKFGVLATVDELHVQFLSAADPRLQKLRQFAHSSVTWFRNPFVQLVLISCEDGEEYKRTYRAHLKALADMEGGPGVAPELLFVYLRPGTVDGMARGPAKVFDSMRRDLNTKRRERCVRLDPPAAEAPQAGLLGLDELERAVKEAIRASFEARQAAYDEEVRRLMLSRQDPSWSFTTLFLFKDSLAVMMEAGGLLDDALREYYELEAVYLEAVQAGQLASLRQGFGGKAPDADEAALMWQTWHGIRQALLQSDTVPEFALRQFLFASQARVLLKQHRLVEVAERGLGFIQTFGALLDQKEREGQVPPGLGAAWSFSAALSLAGTLSTLQGQRMEHRRSETGRGGGSRRRSQFVGGGSSSSRHPSPSPGPASPSLSPTSSLNLAPQLAQLGPSSGGTPLSNPPPEALAMATTPVSATAAGGRGAGGWSPVKAGAGAGSSPAKSAGAGAGTGRREFDASVDWALGTLPGDIWAWEREQRGQCKVDSTSMLYCLLGHLYSNARSELAQLGEAAGLEPPTPAGAEMLGSVLCRGGPNPRALPTPRPLSAGRLSIAKSKSTFSPVSLSSPRHDPSGGQQQALAASVSQPMHPSGSATDLSSASASQGGGPGAEEGGSEGGRSFGAGVGGGPAMQAVDLSSQSSAGGSAVRGPGPGPGPAVPPLDLASAAANAAANVAAGAGGSGMLGSSSTLQDGSSLEPPEGASGVVVRHMKAPSVSSLGGGGPDSSRSLGPRPGGEEVERKLSVRTSRAPFETESQASSPKSSISQVSSSPTRAALREAAAAVHASMGGTETPPLSNRGGFDPSDVRAIERQVMSPAASLQQIDLPAPTPLSLTPGALAPYSPSAPGIPPWLVHWRLRLGLASEDLFCDLWRCLSEAAARCYRQCGRRRHAALLHADVADVLSWRGDVAGATELYHYQARTAIREGWYSLAAQTLPKLAACQLAAGAGPALAHTAAAMLAVPLQYRHEGADEGTACQLLLEAAAAGGEGKGPLAGQPPLLGTMEVGGALSLPHLLSCYPPPSLSSRFFGLTNAAGAPALLPPASDAAQQAQHGGALAAAVGDVALLTLHVASAVPVELPLGAATLTLGVLQQLTVIYTPRSGGQGPPAPPSTPSVAGAAFADAASTPRGPPGTPARGGGGGSAAAAGSATPGGPVRGPTATGEGEVAGSRYVSRWQEVEELQCRLVGIAPLGAGSAPGSTSGSAGEGGSKGPALVLRPGVNVLTFLASPVKRGLYVPKHVRGLLDSIRIHIDIHPPPSLLSPRRPLLLGAPSSIGDVSGLCSALPHLLHLSPRSARRRSRGSVDGGAAALAFMSTAAAEASQGPDSDQGLWGEGDAPPEDIVVMSVESAQPRVALWPAAPGAAIVAGQRQWLGLILSPDRDRLQGGSLAITWPAAGGAVGVGVAAPPPAPGSRRTLSTGLLPVAAAVSPIKVGPAANSAGSMRHRPTMSLGGAGDMAARLGGPSLLRLDAGPAPACLVPMAAAAVMVGVAPPAQQDGGSGSSSGGWAQGGGGQEGDGEVVLAEEAAPGWLLGDPSEQQRFQLAGCAGERPACAVWWWVEAGTYTNPPEAVRIAPPGSHAPTPGSQRPAEQHFLPGDAPVGSQQLPILDLGVNLEYESGCHRSHSRALAVPVVQPFSVHTSARELPSGDIVLQVVLRSNTAVPVTLTSVSLSPQPGLNLRDSLAQHLHLLPLPLPAGRTAALGFILRLTEGLASSGGSGGRLDRAAVAAKLAQAVKLQPSALSVEYELDSRELCGAPAPALGMLGGESTGAFRRAQQQQQLTQRQGGGGSMALGPLGASIPSKGDGDVCTLDALDLPRSPTLGALRQLEALAQDALEEDAGSAHSSRSNSPTKSPTRSRLGRERGNGDGEECGAAAGRGRLGNSGGSGSSGGEVQRCSFTHLMSLQLAPPEEETEGALVLLHLLGPFTAVAGQPITLCWRLERSMAGGSSAAGWEGGDILSPVQSETVPLQYEVVAEGENWRPLGRRSGRVSLGVQPGAVATIEATWVPLMHGTLPVPALKIQDIRYQELFDVGNVNETNCIRVLPQPVEGHILAPPTGL